jgi:hypothetical protein
MQANPGTILALLSLTTNSSASSLFHAKRAYSLNLEINSVTSVLQKLDTEHSLPCGTSRLAAFQEYLGTLKQQYSYSEY